MNDMDTELQTKIEEAKAALSKIGARVTEEGPVTPGGTGVYSISFEKAGKTARITISKNAITGEYSAYYR